jgi:hypothetical protein
MKELVRRLFWPYMVLEGGEIEAKAGSWKCRFLTWLYGEGELYTDGFTSWYPDEE